MSQLKTFNDISKEFGIEGKIDVTNDEKAMYVAAQYGELKKYITRLRVDLTLSENLIKNGENELVRDKASQNRTQFRSDLKQSVLSLKALQELLDELQAS